MTNYSERLDEILQELRTELRPLVDSNGRKWADEQYIAGKDQAKQAIASLIKELVAEAKPEQQKIENMGDTFKVDWARGYNVATDRFEQNLLKELEFEGRESKENIEEANQMNKKNPTN